VGKTPENAGTEQVRERDPIREPPVRLEVHVFNEFISIHTRHSSVVGRIEVANARFVALGS
jgi:hypothetical protein